MAANSRTSKKGAAKAKAPAPGKVLREQDRVRTLEELPSLKKSPAPGSSSNSALPLVDPDAAPPPTVPPLHHEGSDYLDRGQPIPDGYGMDRLVALGRDPSWIYAYWELMGGSLERLRFKYTSEIMGQARWALRVEALGLGQSQIVDVDPKAGRWYLKVASGGRYRVDLGFFTPDNHFEAVCRSQEVLTPSAGLSPILDEQWIIAREDLKRLLSATGAPLVDGLPPGSSERSWPLPRMDHPRAAGLLSGRWVREGTGKSEK